MSVRLKRGVQGLSLLAVVVLAGILVWRIVSNESVHEGQQAPKLALGRLNAPGTLSLASLRGKVVAVNFWASWCGPCRDEAPILEQTWTQKRGQGFVLLGVDANEPAGDGRSFVRKHGLTYPMLHDGNGSTLGHWGVPGLPTTFVIDRQGRVVAKLLGGLTSGDNAKSFARTLDRALAR